MTAHSWPLRVVRPSQRHRSARRGERHRPTVAPIICYASQVRSEHAEELIYRLFTPPPYASMPWIVVVVLPLIGVDVRIGDCMGPMVDEPPPHDAGLPPLGTDMLLPPPPPLLDPLLPPLNAAYSSRPTKAAPSSASPSLLLALDPPDA